MKKILGLDIGTASIGWAWVLEDEKDPSKNRVVDAGVRVIPMGDEQRQFKEGQPVMLNRDRTQRRGMRRMNHRYKLRRAALIEHLTEWNMMPDPDMLTSMSATDLYALRARAATHKVSLKELGRVLYHMNQKRGFRSNRKAVAAEEANDENYTGSIRKRSKELESVKHTVGQHLHHLLTTPVPDATVRLRGLIYLRSDYIAEFNAIWTRQQRYHPQVLTEERRVEMRDRIIFYQRRLKSQKRLVSICRYEKHHKVVPKSSPYFQVFNIWQKVRNLEIRDLRGQVVSLEEDRVQRLVAALQDTARMSRTDVLKCLQIQPTRHYSVNFEKLEGNKTRADIMRKLGEAGVDDTTIRRLTEFDALSGQPDSQPLYRLWHVLYSIENHEDVISTLERQHGLVHDAAQALAAIAYASDYGSLSVRAIRKLLPHMMNGLMYHEACDMAGYRHTDTLTNEDNAQRPLEDSMRHIFRNELRSPVVEKIGNQVASLVNALLTHRSFGRPDEVRIELARELRQNAAQREETTKRNRELEKHNDVARSELQKLGVPAPTRADIQKFLLWKECGMVSLYTGAPIPAAELFVTGSGKWDVDHIIPRSLIFDDSMNNKIICETQENRDKGNRTAFDYMQGKGPEAFEAFEKRILELESRKAVSRGKAWRLRMPVTEVPTDFIERQIRETQYVTREMRTRLQTVCRTVRCSAGMITAHLREQWGLNDVLREVNLEKYRRQGRIEKTKDVRGHTVERITKWSKRDDHRNHALDAIIVACTTPAIVHRLNSLNRALPGGVASVARSRKADVWAIPMPWDSFREQVQSTLRHILISFNNRKRVASRSVNLIQVGGRAGSGETDSTTPLIQKRGRLYRRQVTLAPRGPLHKDTIYGCIMRYRKVPLNARFSADHFVSLAFDEDRQRIEEYIQAHDGDFAHAMRCLAKDPIRIGAADGQVLREVVILEPCYVQRVTIDGSFDRVDKVVDAHVRSVLQKRLEHHGGNSKKAFSNLEQDPIWFDDAHTRIIRHVRIFAPANELQNLHTNNGGKVDYAFTRNNHHVAIFEDENGNKYEKLVTFWEAVKRRMENRPVVDRSAPDGHSFLFSMKINDMFVYGLENDIDLCDPSSREKITTHLYRVQNISSKDYVFRHHLESKSDDNDAELRIQSFGRLAGLKKVHVDRLGDITSVGE